MAKDFTAGVAVFLPRSQREFWRASRAESLLSDLHQNAATTAVNPSNRHLLMPKDSTAGVAVSLQWSLRVRLARLRRADSSHSDLTYITATTAVNPFNASTHSNV
jgi:hypothetical protein